MPCVDLLSGLREGDRARVLGDMGFEMGLCLRDFRRASFTPTQVASRVAAASSWSVRGPGEAVVDADATGSSGRPSSEKSLGNSTRGGVA